MTVGMIAVTIFIAILISVAATIMMLVKRHKALREMDRMDRKRGDRDYPIGLYTRWIRYAIGGNVLSCCHHSRYPMAVTVRQEPYMTYTTDTTHDFLYQQFMRGQHFG